MLLTGESTSFNLHSKHICLLYFPCYLPIIYLPHILFLCFRWRWYLSTSSSQFFELVIPAFLPSTYDIYILINFCFVFLSLIYLLLLAPWQEPITIKWYIFLHLKFVIKSILWGVFFPLISPLPVWHSGAQVTKARWIKETFFFSFPSEQNKDYLFWDENWLSLIVYLMLILNLAGFQLG